jgi:hypothetical protein
MERSYTSREINDLAQGYLSGKNDGSELWDSIHSVRVFLKNKYYSIPDDHYHDLTVDAYLQANSSWEKGSAPYRPYYKMILQRRCITYISTQKNSLHTHLTISGDKPILSSSEDTCTETILDVVPDKKDAHRYLIFSLDFDEDINSLRDILSKTEWEILRDYLYATREYGSISIKFFEKKSNWSFKQVDNAFYKISKKIGNRIRWHEIKDIRSFAKRKKERKKKKKELSSRSLKKKNEV